MNKAEQMEFIDDLANGIRDTLFKTIDGGRIPEDWNGLELRQWLVDKTKELAVGNGSSDMGKARLKKYRNTVICENL